MCVCVYVNSYILCAVGGSSSSDWVRLYNRDPLRLEDPSAPDECSAAFSPPAVADDESDDIPNDRKSEIPPRKV